MMESFLIKLGDKIDGTTKQMLQSLIEKKQKYNRYKHLHFLLLTTAILFGLFVFYLIFKMEIEPSTLSLLDTFSSILNKSHFLVLMMVALTLFGSVKIIYEKKEKSEKEFHALRCEIIDKSKDLWKDERWNDRHIVFEVMKKKYDINLYHESK